MIHKDEKRKFILKELMVEDFAEWEKEIIQLEEKEDTGKSLLNMKLKSELNLCIKNVDKKHTELYFFQTNKQKSMFKRVDHIVFEYLENDKWRVHLIEMKSSISDEKWSEIKGKFRASYLLVQGLAAMLEMPVEEICMYTTYEKALFSLSDTMPSARRPMVGGKYVKPEDEWNSNEVGLNFGIIPYFTHKPIQMKRNENNILVGECICS